MKRSLLALFPVLLLAACASQTPAPVQERTPAAVTAKPAPVPTVVPAGAPALYTVKKGETLYRIALEHGVYYRDLAAWNNIAEPFTIKEGQQLRVTPPGAVGGVVTQPVIAGAPVETRPLGTPAPAADGVRGEPKVNKEPYSDGAWERAQRSGEAARVAEAKPVESKPAEAKPAESKPAETKPAAPETVSLLNWVWPAGGKVAAPFGEGSKGIDIAGKEGDPISAAADGKVFFVGLQKGYGNLLIIGHANGYISVYAHNRKILVAEKQQVVKGQKVAEMGKTDSETGVKLHFEIRQQGKPVDPAGFLPKR